MEEQHLRNNEAVPIKNKEGGGRGGLPYIDKHFHYAAILPS